MAVLTIVLLCSNLIGASKAAQVTLPVLGSATFGAGVLFFPISHISSDILAEVHGYGRDRCMMWAGFAVLILASFISLVVLVLLVALFMVGCQRSLNDVFGNMPRIVAGSLIASWRGSFANSYALMKMKIATEGKWLWTCIAGSTVVSEAVSSSLFYVITFYGTWPRERVLCIVITQYILETGWEIVAAPLTYRVVASLERAENEDYYDRDTNFALFRLKV